MVYLDVADYLVSPDLMVFQDQKEIKANIYTSKFKRNEKFHETFVNVVQVSEGMIVAFVHQDFQEEKEITEKQVNNYLHVKLVH